MSIHTSEPQIRDALHSTIHVSRRNLLAHQIGQVLVSLGAVFIFLPPFNDHIDQSTGQLLISLGRKLRAAK